MCVEKCLKQQFVQHWSVEKELIEISKLPFIAITKTRDGTGNMGKKMLNVSTTDIVLKKEYLSFSKLKIIRNRDTQFVIPLRCIF